MTVSGVLFVLSEAHQWVVSMSYQCSGTFQQRIGFVCFHGGFHDFYNNALFSDITNHSEGSLQMSQVTPRLAHLHACKRPWKNACRRAKSCNPLLNALAYIFVVHSITKESLCLEWLRLVDRSLVQSLSKHHGLSICFQDPILCTVCFRYVIYYHTVLCKWSFLLAPTIRLTI